MNAIDQELKNLAEIKFDLIKLRSHIEIIQEMIDQSEKDIRVTELKIKALKAVISEI
jgi:hypothetical protein